MNGWWYLRDDERIGPVDTGEMQALYQQALIDASTKVWQEGMEAWLPLAEVTALNAAIHEVPPPAPITPDDALRLAQPMAGRWARFFARLFDLGWECLLLVAAASFILDRVSAGFVQWTNKPGYQEAIALLAIPFALVLDALLYSALGNTPGKAALGLHITTLRGERLPLSLALRRNARLWWSGLGLGIPFIALFTLARQSGRLHKGWQASYDDEIGVRVHAQPVGGWRHATFGIVFVACMMSIATLRLMQLDEDRERVDFAAQKFYMWNNPDTGQDIMVDARWVFTPQTNDFGTRLYIFTERTDHAQVIFGPEDAGGVMFSRYVDAFLQNMESTMRFSDRGRFVEMDGMPMWEVEGTMVQQKGSVLTVRILQLDDETFWRLIMVQQPPLDYAGPLIDTLEKSLWQSVMPRQPRPTT